MATLVDPPVAPAAPADPNTPKPYYPDGLPDDVKGASDKETIDKLNARAKGLRDKLAQQPGAAGSAAEDYAVTLADDLKKHFDPTREADKPIFDLAAKSALAAGLPKDSFNKFIGGFLGELVKSGAVKPADVQTPEAMAEKAKAAAASELEALAKTAGGKEKAQQLIKDEMAYLAQQEKLGIISTAERADLMVIFGTATGFNAWMKLRRSFTGHEIPPTQSDPAQALSVQAARALFKDPKYQSDPAFRADADRKLAEATQRAKRAA